MSGKLMAHVYDYQFTHGEQSILLAMADHADDDGHHIFPSIAYLSWKTDYSERQIQRMLKDLVRRRVLIVVAPAHAQRATEYRLHLSAAQPKQPFHTTGDTTTPVTMSPVTPRHPRGDISDTGGVTFRAERGDIAMSPEPPYRTTNLEPSVGGRVREVSATARAPTRVLIEIPDPFPAQWIPEFAKEHGLKLKWTEDAAFRYVLHYSGTATRRSIEEWTNKCQKWILEDHEKGSRTPQRR